MTTAAIQSVNAEQTDEVWLVLLEITHPSLVTPIRVVNNTQPIVSNGNTYLASAFNLTLPDDVQGLSFVEIEIDNVDRVIVDTIRALATPPSVSLFVVLADTPDSIEFGPHQMKLSDVDYNASTVKGTLIYEDLLNEPFPGRSFDKSRYPGLF